MNIIVINGNENNKDYIDVLRESGKELYSQGFVHEDFAQACIEREKVFPTGLGLLEPVAIPHCNSGHAITDSICVVRLDKPVEFALMDDADKKVNVKLIFNIAVANPSNQVGVLSKLINIIKTNENVSFCINEDANKVKEYIEKELA